MASPENPLLNDPFVSHKDKVSKSSEWQKKADPPPSSGFFGGGGAKPAGDTVKKAVDPPQQKESKGSLLGFGSNWGTRAQGSTPTPPQQQQGGQNPPSQSRGGLFGRFGGGSKPAAPPPQQQPQQQGEKLEPTHKRSGVGEPSITDILTLSLGCFIFTAALFMVFWELWKPLPIFVAGFLLCWVFVHDPWRERAKHLALKKRETGMDEETGFENNSLDVASNKLWLRVVVAWLGVLMGSVCGMNAEEKYMSHFYAIEYGSEYADVLASTPGAAYMDAGSMNFATSSKIDAAQSVGFRRGITFCAAPIIDANQGHKSIAYWAIGYDCCEQRGDFECGETNSTMGVRAPPDGFFYHDTRLFMDAVKQAAAVNDLTLDDDIVLLHWDKDPGARKVTKLFKAIGAICLGTAIFALFAVAVVCTTPLVSKFLGRDG